MRESFNEYKKTLEPNLMKFDYLYSGDAISSTDSSFSELKNNNIMSPLFIIKTINNIYEESINNMINKSKSIIINKSNINMPILKEVKKLTTNLSIPGKIIIAGIDVHYAFCGKNAINELFNAVSTCEKSAVFPHYFYKTINNVFYSPLIIEEEGISIIYVTDAAIQSLVYSIQNMDYIIKKDGVDINGSNYWKHTINYKLFDCNFNSYKIVIKDISKIRDDKIKKILNGN